MMNGTTSLLQSTNVAKEGDAQREVSWLERSPPNIWAYFVWYISGEQLVRFKITGAPVVWQRLKSPAVVKSIKLGHDLMAFTSLPSFMKDFPSLEGLSIESCSPSWSKKLGLTIESIPSGIRQLKLSGSWIQSGKELFGVGGATLKLDEHLPYLELLDLSPLKLTSYSWMIHSPPSLTKLCLPYWGGTVELPSCLIHFEATLVELSEESFVSKLPSRLETFTTDLAGVELVVPLLPPSTRNLSFGLLPEWQRPMIAQNFLKQLPKSLARFVVPEEFPCDTNFESNPELAALLPSTLTQLDIAQSFPCTAWSLLPPHLTILTLQGCESSCTVVSRIVDNHGVSRDVESIPFDFLPRSITSLTLVTVSSYYCFCGPPAATNQSYFPPHLTYLRMDQVQLSPEAAKLLPSSLTFLKIRNLCERVCEHLPKGLKSLESEQPLMSPNLIKFLPRSLTLLWLSIPHRFGPWFDYTTGDRIEFSNLPEYSIHQNCLSNGFDWKEYSHLPPTLTLLNLDRVNELGDSFLLHQQLPNLLELKLSQSKHFTDVLVPLLSPHLTTLNIPCSSEISGKSFQNLPRGLTYLDLQTSEQIFDSDIQHLPRTLKRLKLICAIQLTELCIRDLPPQLERLDLSKNLLITPSSFPYLPCSLRASQNYSKSPEDTDWESTPAIFAKWKVSHGVIHHSQGGHQKDA